MRGSSSNALEKLGSWKKPIRTLLLITLPCLLILIWLLGIYEKDPFVQSTLELAGSVDQGSKLFRINCVGCHGIGARGLLGPDLHDVTQKYSESAIIHQVVRGLTPPMPSFEMEPQAMADLIAYLNSIT